MNKIISSWYNLSDKIRFVIIGGLNFCVSYAIYALLCILLGNSYYQISLALSWVLSSFVSYATQKILVFKSRGNIVKEYLKCCTTWVISYIINAVLLEITVKMLGLNVYIAQFIAALTAAICTYFMFKYFAFKNNN